VVFSDGSQGKEGLGYGYVVMQPGQERPLASGKGKLDDCSVVFDAEALGAWRGTERALQVASPGTNVTLCADNTAAIWCLRGTASETSQWAFLAFHKAVSEWSGNVQVKWSPGHLGIRGNELADGLAKEGQKSAPDLESGPTYPSGSQSRDRIQTQTNPPAPLAQEPEWTLAEIQGMEAQVRHSAASCRAGNTIAASATPFSGHSDRAR